METFRDKTVEDVSELRELSEWNTFTIALYGETNAGKSTLIETLRIQLGHSEKLATQEKFNALIKDLPIDPNDLVALGPTIQTLEAKLADGQTQVQILEKDGRTKSRCSIKSGGPGNARQTEAAGIHCMAKVRLPV